MVASAPGADPAAHSQTMRRMKGSGDYLADHFEDVPLLLFVFAIDDLGGANISPRSGVRCSPRAQRASAAS